MADLFPTEGIAPDGSPITLPQPTDPRLGRIPVFDPRSRNFAVLTDEERRLLPPRSYTWSCGQVLNQGNVGACVGFSISHELIARPVVVPGISNATAMELYKQAQLIDPWPGEAYEGTSVLAGMSVAKSRGYIEEYRWAFGIDDVVLALGYKGPVVLGINWHDAMFRPEPTPGFTLPLIRPDGPIAGGHAILANGISIRLGVIRLHNSWGGWWGVNGEAFIRISDLATLLQAYGEACIPVKRLTGV